MKKLLIGVVALAGIAYGAFHFYGAPALAQRIEAELRAAQADGAPIRFETVEGAANGLGYDARIAGFGVDVAATLEGPDGAALPAVLSFDAPWIDVSLRAQDLGGARVSLPPEIVGELRIAGDLAPAVPVTIASTDVFALLSEGISERSVTVEGASLNVTVRQPSGPDAVEALFGQVGDGTGTLVLMAKDFEFSLDGLRDQDWGNFDTASFNADLRASALDVTLERLTPEPASASWRFETLATTTKVQAGLLETTFSAASAIGSGAQEASSAQRATFKVSDIESAGQASANDGGWKIERSVTATGAGAIDLSGDGSSAPFSSAAIKFSRFDSAYARTDRGDGKGETKFTQEGLEVSVQSAGASYGGAAETVSVALATAGAMGRAPLKVDVAGLIFDDATWQLLDPGGAFPREPSSLRLDGAARLAEGAFTTFDLNPQKLALNPEDVEGIEVLEFSLSAVGLDVSGVGNLALSGDRPEGRINIETNGLVETLQASVAAGYLPPQQALFASMMIEGIGRRGETAGDLDFDIVFSNGLTSINGAPLGEAPAIPR